MDHPSQYDPDGVSRLVAYLESVPYERRAEMLLTAGRLVGGEYTPPGSATHLHEITLYGLHARGEDEENLVRNWLVVANNTMRGQKRLQVAPEQARMEATLIERAAAISVIARPDLHSNTRVAEACQTIIDSHADPVEYQRANLLLIAIKRDFAA